MTFNIISDLHCDIVDHNHPKPNSKIDWLNFDPTKLVSADYLIIAGDLGFAETEDKILEDLKEKTKGKFKDILYIKGNHSYWNVYKEIKKFEATPENAYIDVVDGDIAIIGTTLWTPSFSFRELRDMNDYRYTPKFKGEDKLKRWKEESEWLRNKYNEYKSQGKKIVIVTHHNPRKPAILPENSWEHSDVATAYWVLHGELDDIKPDIWICGHIHESLDIEHDGTRFVRHPIGYRWWPYWGSDSNKKDVDSWYNKIVEI